MTWVSVKVVGKTLTNPDGTVRTLNPSSLMPPYGTYIWTASPPGQDGQYETCAISGGTVTYNPTGHQPVVFGFQPVDPSNAGFGALCEEPL